MTDILPKVEGVQSISEDTEEVSIGPETPSPVESIASTPQTQKDTTPQPVKQSSESVVLNVVDKSTHEVEVSGVDEAADEITKGADEEEEKFIGHVEEVHSIV